MSSRATRGRRGVVLLAVVFFYLLLLSFVATFVRKASLDTAMIRNRDAIAQAEALARGGIQLAVALLVEDRLQELQTGTDTGAEHLEDVWARAGRLDLPAADGGTLRLRIEDTGARLNLNALFDGGEPLDDSESFLNDLLTKVIDEMPVAAEEKDYDILDLAHALIDYVDGDEISRRGEPEDLYYQDQEPRYRAANRPLLSVDELRLVRGFDAPLVEALRPYVTVFPYTSSGGMGVNPNTAPSWVLATLYSGTAGDYRLATETLVGDLLEVREDGQRVCHEETVGEGCVPPGNVGLQTTFPPPSYRSDVFQVRAEATVGDVRRTVVAVIDRRDLADPQVLAWSVE